MLYSLTCGDCLAQNYVDSGDPAISWTCQDCGNDNASSMPLKADGTLVTDASKSEALLSTAEASAIPAADIVDSVPLGSIVQDEGVGLSQPS